MDKFVNIFTDLIYSKLMYAGQCDYTISITFMCFLFATQINSSNKV